MPRIQRNDNSAFAAANHRSATEGSRHILLQHPSAFNGYRFHNHVIRILPLLFRRSSSTLNKFGDRFGCALGEKLQNCECRRNFFTLHELRHETDLAWRLIMALENRFHIYFTAGFAVAGASFAALAATISDSAFLASISFCILPP